MQQMRQIQTAVLVVFFLDQTLSTKNQATLETCSPASDLIFVLDGGLYIDFARDIIMDYNTHHIPDYAVRVGLVLCEDDSVHYLPLQSGMNDVADKFAGIRYIYTFQKLNVHSKEPMTQALINRQINTLTFLSSSNASCLALAREMFLNPIRDDVGKMAMFVTNGDWWNTTDHVDDALLLKEDNITLVTVAVGVQDIDTLNDLMTIASGEGTFVVVKDKTALNVLATELSRGNCQPITLQLKYPETISNNYTTTAVPRAPCNRRKLGENTYEQLTYYPGFGYLVDHKETCPDRKLFNQDLCGCI
ncbi:uncharacterized protein [Haliotis cracherodii]|uniref:uncharacterized protein n=1 Tax=Haliotis cracherodii TaxID=6455 RepID=UPI0039E7B6D0